jgi:hypothetical protein
MKKYISNFLLVTIIQKEFLRPSRFGEIKTSSVEAGNLSLFPSRMFRERFGNLSIHRDASWALTVDVPIISPAMPKRI